MFAPLNAITERRFPSELFGSIHVVGALEDIDELTLARAKRGDSDAFARIVGLYARPVHALIGRITVRACSPDEVEELAQETFVRVFRALGDFEPRGPGRLGKWILTIASRLAVDRLRRHRPLRPALDDTPDPTERADRLLHRRTIANAIADAVAELSPTQRAVFVLREYHGMEYEEIARALDLDLGTVKSRLSRARARLRVALQEVRHG